MVLKVPFCWLFAGAAGREGRVLVVRFFPQGAGASPLSVSASVSPTACFWLASLSGPFLVACLSGHCLSSCFAEVSVWVADSEWLPFRRRLFSVSNFSDFIWAESFGDADMFSRGMSKFYWTIFRDEKSFSRGSCQINVFKFLLGFSTLTSLSCTGPSFPIHVQIRLRT